MGETISAGGLEFFLENRQTTDDGGPSMQILLNREQGLVQLLRFDLSDGHPHYHYGPGSQNIRYDLDRLTHPDPIGWACGQIRERLQLMLEKSGFGAVCSEVDFPKISTALQGIEDQWRSFSEAETRQ